MENDMSFNSFVSVAEIVKAVRTRVSRNAAHLKRGMRALTTPTFWRRHVTLPRVWTMLVLGGYAGLACAQSAAPWEGGLCGVAGWFKGPTMIAIGTIAFGAAAGGFVFGEEMTGIMKKVSNITMAVCLAVGGASFLGWIAVKAGATSSTCGS
jgi:type IV secretion system protein VirB2